MAALLRQALIERHGAKAKPTPTALRYIHQLLAAFGSSAVASPDTPQDDGHWLPADFKDTRPLFDAGAIAPLHRACAERALTHCPHLSGMADRELKPFPDGWIVIPLTIEAKPPAALGGSQASVPVISFLQLIGVSSEA